MKTCPFCFMEDLVDQATKCPHCAAWLTEGREGVDKLRQDLRQELKDDLKTHRDYLNNLLNRVQWAAGSILILVIGAAAFFGFRTDQSITDITEAIKEQAETKITKQVENEIGGDKMKARIEKEIDIASDNIRKVIDDSISDLQAQASQQVAEFEKTSENVFTEIAALEVRIAPTAQKLEEIEALSIRAKAAANRTQNAIVEATKAPVEKDLAALPVDTFEASPKEGVGKIAELMRRRVKALSFWLGRRGYYGPAIWRYFVSLSKLPEFRYAVVLDADGSLFGVLDASALVSTLNPPNAGELAERFPANRRGLPDPTQVPMWSRFADQLSDGDAEALQEYPSFVSRASAVPLGWDKQSVLDRMEELRVEWLPVVDEQGRAFVGIIDRSRLTTSLVLEIAKGLQ